MKKTKIFLTSILILFAINQLQSQSMVLVIENLKNNNEHIVKPGDKVKLDIKNKKGKLKEKEEVRISSIDKKNIYVEPLKNRFPNQPINIEELKYISIRTTGTKTTGCLLFVANIFSRSGSSKTATVYKKINFENGKWEKRVEGK